MAVDIRGRKMKKPPACVQCRKRKIGCDRAKPICGNCLRNGKNDCFYPDVPGVYVQSSSATNSAASQSLLHSNPELANLEQIREYNTRLQLMNAAQRATPTPIEQPQFIPRVSAPPTSMESQQEHSLNYVQGPAIFDVVQVPYTQEEVLLKEVDFLKSRLWELRQLTGRPLNLDFNKECEDGKENEYKNSTNKKQKLHNHEAHSSINAVNEFHDIDPAFLDGKTVFNVFSKKSKFLSLSATNLYDTPNSVFDIRHLTVRDDFLCVFHNKLYDVMSNSFPEKLVQSQSAASSPLDASDFLLKFPSKSLVTTIITKFAQQVDVTSLIPILSVAKSLHDIETLLPNQDSILAPSNVSTDQFLALGNISICLLLAYHSLASSVLIPLKNDDLDRFNTLGEWVDPLENNVRLIKRTFDSMKQCSHPIKIKIVKYLSLLKLYESLSSTAMAVNSDDDVQLAIQLGLDNESTDQNLIMLWNSIYKNYCWRHAFRGEIPLLISLQNVQSTPVIDPILVNNIELLKFQIGMLKYLHSKEQTLSLNKILGLQDEFRSKLNLASQKCFSASLTLNNVVDTLIYRNAQLFTDFYLLLHYETTKDKENFAEKYGGFLQFFQETVFYIFSGLANIRFAGYEFLFVNYSFTVLYNLCFMIFSLHQRSHNCTQYEMEQQQEVLMLLLRKISMLLTDYSKNCRRVNPIVHKIEHVIAAMLETAKNQTGAKQYLLYNGFQEMDTSLVQKNVAKLRTISESLIKTDFYKQREPFVAKSPTTCGITSQNFQDIYEAFY